MVAAASASGLPPARPINANDTEIEGFVPCPDGPIQNIDYWNFVGRRYFETMGARLIEGRFLNDNDGAAMHRRWWRSTRPWRAPSGRMKAPSATACKLYATAKEPPGAPSSGVVADIKNAGLDRATGTELYFPPAQGPRRRLSYLIRTNGGRSEGRWAPVRNQVRGIDRALPISDVRTMEDVMYERALASALPHTAY